MGEVTPCWDEAFEQISLGEKTKFSCPREKAFGNQGIHESHGVGPIPPQATLTFNVYVMGIAAV